MGNNIAKLEKAIDDGNIKYIEQYIKKNDINKRIFDRYRYQYYKNLYFGYEKQGSILHYVLCLDKFIIAELLINNGADVNFVDKDQNTPLHYVRNLKICKMLIDNGADVNAVNKSLQTPLHWTANGEICKLLVENGADVKALDILGNTPLHYHCNYRKCKFLMENGIDVDVRNNKGETPLFKNIHDPYAYEGLKLLIDNGADVNTIVNGESLLSVAIQYKYRCIKNLELIIENGAVITLRDVMNLNKNDKELCNLVLSNFCTKNCICIHCKK